jgi:hypothetical protein
MAEFAIFVQIYTIVFNSLTVMNRVNRLLPLAIALMITLMAASCLPQKQYGCPNHLRSGAVVQ